MLGSRLMTIAISAGTQTELDGTIRVNNIRTSQTKTLHRSNDDGRSCTTRARLSYTLEDDIENTVNWKDIMARYDE